MLCWQAANGGAPFSAVALNAGELRLPDPWEHIFTVQDLEVWCSGTDLCCLTGSADARQVNACSATASGLAAMSEQLGLCWDWSSLEEC
ncbi:MAG: hypothetical protein OXT09_12385 [Myxococcales bacterium]|nr:hypothetical protein [Myxococcales bacterium]